MAPLVGAAALGVCAVRSNPNEKRRRRQWCWWGSGTSTTAKHRQQQQHYAVEVEEMEGRGRRSAWGGGGGGGGGGMEEVIRKAVDNLFWLRFLEDRQQQQQRTIPAFSPYPPGLSCVELMMADFEALRLYMYSYKSILSTPMPQQYDPRQLAAYFSCRPHLLAFRIIQVIFAFVSAAIKLKTSARAEWTRDTADERKGPNSSQYFVGQLLKEIFLDLGPTFIKVGQSLSTRPDLIGSEISEALAELHEKVPPFSREVAMQIIQEEFGCPLDTVFSYISDEPVAAASFGQVYQGCTVDGAAVAVKVQRPNLLPSVLRDTYILRLGLAFLRKVAKRKSNLSLYADELGKGFVGELDYTIEAENASKFLEAHSRYSFIFVPKIFKQLTRKRVLTMEWVVGESPNELLSLSKGFSNKSTESLERQRLQARARLLDLVNKGVEASLVQLLETGLLHADPHPGNLRYTAEGCIGFLDFGLLCMMEKKHQRAMLASIVHIVNADWAALVYDLTEMDVVPPRTSLRRVTMDLEEALGEVAFEDGIPDIKFSRVLAKILSVALKYHFRMPPYYTLVLRSLASLEGLAIAADQKFKTFQAAYPYVVRKLLYDNSLASRRVLHQAVFNKRKELKWQKIVQFLKLGSARKGMNIDNLLKISDPSAHGQLTRESALQTANLCLRLLLSRDGMVIRRLIMTADAKSLARDMVSKNAVFFRVLLRMVLADLVCQWMVKVIGLKKVRQHEHHISMTRGNDQRDMGVYNASNLAMYEAAIRDRRLKIIFFKFIRDLRGDPIQMLRVSWSLLVVFATSAALGLHHFIVYLSEEYLPSFTFAPRRLVHSV